MSGISLYTARCRETDPVSPRASHHHPEIHKTVIFFHREIEKNSILIASLDVAEEDTFDKIEESGYVDSPTIWKLLD